MKTIIRRSLTVVMLVLSVIAGLALANAGAQTRNCPITSTAYPSPPGPYPVDPDCASGPPPTCKPWYSWSFPPSAWGLYAPVGEAYCHVIMYDATGRWDFPVDGCFYSRCVKGIGTDLVEWSAPGELENVTLFTTVRVPLPVVFR